jgi:hypothetical protein
MRGLLVTPWFAAGAGFVIAAALALNSPHTVLTYKPNTSTCSTCVPRQSLATARPGVVLKTPKPAPAVRSDRRPRPAVPAHPAPAPAHPAPVPAGPALGYRVVWTRHGAFGAIITIPRAEASHGWKLRFEIPGRRILGVWGAQWAPAGGGYGGEASSFGTQPQPGSPGSSGPAPSPGPGQSGDPGQSGHRGAEQLRFVVSAQGAPRTPAECVLNGVSCHFG